MTSPLFSVLPQAIVGALPNFELHLASSVFSLPTSAAQSKPATTESPFTAPLPVHSKAAAAASAPWGTRKTPSTVSSSSSSSGDEDTGTAEAGEEDEAAGSRRPRWW